MKWFGNFMLFGLFVLFMVVCGLLVLAFINWRFPGGDPIARAFAVSALMVAFAARFSRKK